MTGRAENRDQGDDPGIELDDLHRRFADVVCTCGHVFSNHRKLWGGDEPGIAWRCDTSDGCMDFTLAWFVHDGEAGHD